MKETKLRKSSSGNQSQKTKLRKPSEGRHMKNPSLWKVEILSKFDEQKDVGTWSGFWIYFLWILDLFWVDFAVKNRFKINVKSMLDFGSIFGGSWGGLRKVKEL